LLDQVLQLERQSRNVVESLQRAVPQGSDSSEISDWLDAYRTLDPANTRVFSKSIIEWVE